MARHESLRSSFYWMAGGRLTQLVWRTAALSFTVHDWSSEADYAQRISAWREEDRARGVDVRHPPLMRVAVFHRPDGDHDLVWTTHHAIIDGWSSALVVAEMLRDYRARAGGERADFVRAMSYRDYVAWLTAQPDTEAWWRVRLTARDEPVSLVDAIGYPRGRSSDFQRLRRRLGQYATARCQQVARDLRVTPHTLFQAAWAIVLARVTGQRRVAFGTTVAGRPAALPEIERTVGLFINSLPVHLDVPADQPVACWLRELQAFNGELWAHGHTPLAQIQKYAGRPGVALFDSLLVFENVPIEDGIQGEGSALELVSFEALSRTHYPLTLTVFPGSEVDLDWEWDGSLFSASTMEGLSSSYELVLGLLCDAAGKDRAVGSVSVPVSGGWHRAPVVGGFRDVVSRLRCGVVAGWSIGCGVVRGRSAEPFGTGCVVVADRLAAARSGCRGG